MNGMFVEWNKLSTGGGTPVSNGGSRQELIKCEYTRVFL